MKVKTKKLYRVRDMQTGMYLVGRHSYNRPAEPTWHKSESRSRLWKRLCDITDHISWYDIVSRAGGVAPAHWEIVEYEVIETSRFSAQVLSK